VHYPRPSKQTRGFKVGLVFLCFRFAAFQCSDPLSKVKRSFEKGDHSGQQKDKLERMHAVGMACTRLAECCEDERMSLVTHAAMNADLALVVPVVAPTENIMRRFCFESAQFYLTNKQFDKFVHTLRLWRMPTDPIRDNGDDKDKASRGAHFHVRASPSLVTAAPSIRSLCCLQKCSLASGVQ
jgi:hypothetical protein